MAIHRFLSNRLYLPAEADTGRLVAEIDATEKKKMDERNIAEQVNIHNRKLELLEMQESAKESEREYQLKLKE